ncbi:hypothetical protein [Planotetraspora sp. GP83]|uniref:hypothetical protein n=1 Tax=Planotetraspora sp. GP83 TaxID=3156264 RepID=UPI0035180FFE
MRTPRVLLQSVSEDGVTLVTWSRTSWKTRPGGAVPDPIRAAADGIAVFGPGSAGEGWALEECAALMRASAERGLRFIPVSYGGASVSGFAANWTWRDFGKPEKNTEPEELARLRAENKKLKAEAARLEARNERLSGELGKIKPHWISRESIRAAGRHLTQRGLRRALLPDEVGPDVPVDEVLSPVPRLDDQYAAGSHVPAMLATRRPARPSWPCTRPWP